MRHVHTVTGMGKSEAAAMSSAMTSAGVRLGSDSGGGLSFSKVSALQRADGSWVVAVSVSFDDFDSYRHGHPDDYDRMHRDDEAIYRQDSEFVTRAIAMEHILIGDEAGAYPTGYIPGRMETSLYAHTLVPTIDMAGNGHFVLRGLGAGPHVKM